VGGGVREIGAARDVRQLLQGAKYVGDADSKTIPATSHSKINEARAKNACGGRAVAATHTRFAATQLCDLLSDVRVVYLRLPASLALSRGDPPNKSRPSQHTC
jgi:hypothetical protein